MGSMRQDAGNADEAAVRRADAGDGPEMLRVERAAHALLADHGVHLDALQVPDGFEEPTTWTVAFVAAVRGRVVGMARLSQLEPELLCLDQLSVDPNHAGRGIGRQLLDALVAAAEHAGYWKLQGRLFTTNAASRALARRSGFREVGVYERHGRLDGEWKDLLIVERLLGDAAR